MIDPIRIEDHSDAVADLNEIVAAVVIASTLDQDRALRLRLRRLSDCPDDQPLNLELSVGSAVLQLRPGGTIFPVRRAAAQTVTNFAMLLSRSPDLRRTIDLARARVTKNVQAGIVPFLRPGALPSREEYVRLERWAPLIEVPAYRFCARALSELNSWRSSALAEATHGISQRETVLERYYALIHTVGHFTLLCSGPGTAPWLSDMAKALAWDVATPSFPLLRERTMWLAAAAARSAAAFGAGVVDRYADILARSTDVMQRIDALYGLTAIGLSDGAVRESIAGVIAAEGNLARRLTGTEFTDAAFRSAISCLTRTEAEPAADLDLCRRLSWQPASLRGLATSEMFRLDPTEIDETGQMIGFRALPYILQAKMPFHYPLRARAREPLLPTLDEMPELFLRAWGAPSRVSRTMH